MGIGHVGPLLPAGPQTHPEPAAAAEGDLALDDLVPALERVGPGVQVGGEACPLIALGEDQPGGRHRADGDEGAEMAQPRPGEVQHGQHRHRGDDRRPEVGLGDHQQAGQGGHRDHGDTEFPDVADEAALALEHVGGDEDEGKLGELGGLHRDRAEGEPAAGAAAADPDTGDEGRDEAGQGQPEQGPGQFAQAAVVEPGEAQQGDETQGRSHELLAEEQERRAVGLEGLDRGCGEDHDKAHPDQGGAGRGHETERVALPEGGGDGVRLGPGRSERAAAQRTPARARRPTAAAKRSPRSA